MPKRFVDEQYEFSKLLSGANNRAVWERVHSLRLPAHDLENDELAEVRWQIFAGKPGPALDSLARLIREASTSKRHRRVLKLRTLQSLAQGQDGDLRAALASMTDVLRLTCNTVAAQCAGT